MGFRTKAKKSLQKLNCLSAILGRGCRKTKNEFPEDLFSARALNPDRTITPPARTGRRRRWAFPPSPRPPQTGNDSSESDEEYCNDDVQPPVHSGSQDSQSVFSNLSKYGFDEGDAKPSIRPLMKKESTCHSLYTTASNDMGPRFKQPTRLVSECNSLFTRNEEEEADTRSKRSIPSRQQACPPTRRHRPLPAAQAFPSRMSPPTKKRSRLSRRFKMSRSRFSKSSIGLPQIEEDREAPPMRQPVPQPSLQSTFSTFSFMNGSNSTIMGILEHSSVVRKGDDESVSDDDLDVIYREQIHKMAAPLIEAKFSPRPWDRKDTDFRGTHKWRSEVEYDQQSLGDLSASLKSPQNALPIQPSNRNLNGVLHQSRKEEPFVSPPPPPSSPGRHGSNGSTGLPGSPRPDGTLRGSNCQPEKPLSQVALPDRRHRDKLAADLNRESRTLPQNLHNSADDSKASTALHAHDNSTPSRPRRLTRHGSGGLENLCETSKQDKVDSPFVLNVKRKRFVFAPHKRNRTDTSTREHFVSRITKKLSFARPNQETVGYG